MPSPIYRKLLEDRINAFLKESRSIAKIPQPGLKGEIRESALGKLISSLLPVDWDIGTGKIINAYGKESPQTDLIIYFKRVFPPFLFSQILGLFPLECCGFAFEIKSKLTASELKKTIKNFNSLKTMEEVRPWSEPAFIQYSMRPIRVCFALNSDITIRNEFERYKQLDSDYLDNPSIEILCIINKGLWVYRHTTSRHSAHWIYYEPRKKHEEMLRLLGIIISQVISMATFDSMNVEEYFFETIDQFPKDYLH